MEPWPCTPGDRGVRCGGEPGAGLPTTHATEGVGGRGARTPPGSAHGAARPQRAGPRLATRQGGGGHEPLGRSCPTPCRPPTAGPPTTTYCCACTAAPTWALRPLVETGPEEYLSGAGAGAGAEVGAEVGTAGRAGRPDGARSAERCDTLAGPSEVSRSRDQPVTPDDWAGSRLACGGELHLI